MARPRTQAEMPPRRRAAPKSTPEIAGHADPRAPLDSKRLLAAATPVLERLAADLLDRAKRSPAITSALQAQHRAEQSQRRTADPFLVWQASFVDQVAAAWLLSCVFVRTLEDRGLLAHARLAGPGAADSQRLFFEMAPSLGERDYLLAVFREMCRFPAARALFDAEHNPVWLLAPSSEAAQGLLGLFRSPVPEAPVFRFGQEDTRFLGDLYQDLNEAVQKRYALLQTPRFVESFILDRTLERAIERFGLDEATLIDPTCGSGHFLLGAFERLYDHRLRAEPGLGEREAARKALDAVYGTDINPYAVAIARFRLTLAYVEKAGFKKIAEAPVLPLHVVVADSLLHNAQRAQVSFGEVEGQSAETWGGKVFALEDERAAREVLYRRYAAVVGNPPYITVKDKALKERYKEMYKSAFREYSLGVPFTERFFQLARDGGSVGMITANSFMKRGFGEKLISEYLPTVNLDLVVNTSGAYIPGHGTPTVLLFGTMESAQGNDVLTVLAKRGEPTTPEDAEQGFVWQSITGHWQEVGFDNEFISVARVDRVTLKKHPWSLGGGGAAELKELLEERTDQRLENIVDVVGFGAVTREDEVFVIEAGAGARWQLPAEAVAMYGYGEALRDWSIGRNLDIVFPYTTSHTLPIAALGRYGEIFWLYRTQLWLRQGKGFKTKRDSGGAYYEYSMFYPERHFTPLKIAFAFVATHNQFVLSRGGTVFNRSAPIIKLPETATDDDHLALLAYLNSSTACFWMKQVFQAKNSQRDVGDTRDKPERTSYEFAGTGLSALPIPVWSPEQRTTAIDLARRAAGLAEERERHSETAAVDLIGKEAAEAQETLSSYERKRDDLLAQSVVVQEDIDWLFYQLFGLTERWQASGDLRATPESRPAFNPASPLCDVWAARSKEIATKPDIRLLEDPMYKRPWLGRQGVFGHGTMSFREGVSGAARDWMAARAEEQLSAGQEILSAADLLRRIVTRPGVEAVSTLAGAEQPLTARWLVALADTESVPYLAAHRYTDTGLDKRAAWEQTWDLQRAEDRGEKVGEIPVPPKYDPKDYRDPTYWRLRGKLDVPKERFISYPGCESDEDGEPVYGWAGWNHLQQAQALAALYQNFDAREK